MRKKITAALLSFLFLLMGLSVSAEEVPEISAYAAILYDPLTGTVLYERNSREVLPMASTTKIMTALLAFESGCANESVKVSEEMVAVEGSSMGLMTGDVLTLGSIAEGMMMASGNDGANAIALYLGGTAEGFAELMNARAAEIGMTQTNFVTASGLDAEGHGSTAYDMALLAAEAMECPEFADTVGQFSLMVDFIEPEKTVRYDNHNRLLNMYEDCTGIKTGFTKKAGRCLVSSAERDGAELICVTLNAPDDWNDHIALFEYGFAQFFEQALMTKPCTVPVVGGEGANVVCLPDSEPTLMLPKGTAVTVRVELPRFVYAPIKAGESIGTAVYTANSTEIARVPLSAENEIRAAADARSGFLKWLDRVFG